MSATELAEQHEIRALYSNHHGWLQGWLRRRLGNSTDASDLAQDVFMRILARRHAAGAREPRAYLSAIARGLVIDHWRRRELEQAWLATLAALPAAEAPSPEHRASLLEALVEIDRLLDSLRPPVRRAFLLAQLDGLTCPQIAQELGVSLATAERYIAKARGLQDQLASLPPELTRATLDSVATRRLKSRRNALKMLAGAGICTAAGLYTLREFAESQQPHLRAETKAGEQRSLRLSDGTALKLNTDTAVSVDLSGSQRLVTLKRGEILIETGKDQRPFWVRTRFGTLQALGTRFVVRMEPGRVRVSVQEGAVQLHPAESPAVPIVQASESFWLSKDSATRAQARGFSEDAWAHGVIAAKDMRLADVLAELARYRHGYVTCDDAVADMRVSGIFHVGDTDRTLQFLAQTQQLELRYYSRYWVRVARASS